MRWRDMWMLALVLVVAGACSSTPEEVELGSGDLPAPAAESTIVDKTTTTTTTTTTTLPSRPKKTTTTTAPRAFAPIGEAPRPWIDPADALIDGVIVQGADFAGSIRPMIGYGPIDVQTDCDALNLFEARVEASGITRYLNATEIDLQHQVFDAPKAAQSMAEAAGRVARECASMAWLEGGVAENEPLQVELPKGWVGFRQTDVGSDQFIWVGVAARENLLSVVTLATWGHVPGEPDTDLFMAAIIEADEKLWLAEPIEGDPVPVIVPATTTTTTAPPVRTSVPELSDPDPLPPAGPGILAPLLFDESDIGRPFELDDVTIDAEEFEDCQNAEAFASFFGSLQVVAFSEGDDFDVYLVQFVGIAESPDQASKAVRVADELTTCAMFLGPEEHATYRRLTDLPDGVIDAAVITVSGVDESYDLVFLQLDEQVSMYLAYDQNSGFSIDELISMSASKLPAYRTWVADCLEDYPSAAAAGSGDSERWAECVGVEAYFDK